MLRIILTTTIDDKNTHHGLGSIAIANGKFNNFDTRRTPLPRDTKHRWSDIHCTQGILIQNHHAPDKPALNQVDLHPVVEEQFKASLELLSCII